jgi:hypothetical protein
VIPEQLAQDRCLIKIHPPEADCNHPGKEPVGSATEGPFYTASDAEIRQWIEDGGNVGRALIDDTIVFDVDSKELGEILREKLPRTFIVQSGGGGEHWYYKSSWDQNRQLNENGNDLGSIRANGWQVVCPPSHHPSGSRYQVAEDREQAEITESEVEKVLGEIDQQPTQAAAAAAASRRGTGCVGSIPEVPDEYPDRKVSIQTARRWVEGNDLGLRFDRVGEDIDESGDDYVLCKCLAEAGISVPIVVETLNEFRATGAKWHRRGDDYRIRTAVKAVRKACDDGNVDFSSTADMASDEAERRKTESGSTRTRHQGGENMSSNNSSFTVEEKAIEYNDDGEAVQARLMQGYDEDDGEHFQYIDVATGSVKKIETVEGESVKAPQINDNPGQTDSLGSPEKLELHIQALQQLKEQLESK